MARSSNISNLPTEDQARVDECIRAHRYANLDFIMVATREMGLTGFSRSALARYVNSLKERDSLHANPVEGTIVTIVERGTGEVRVVKTSASGLAIAALIAKVKGAPLLS